MQTFAVLVRRTRLTAALVGALTSLAAAEKPFQDLSVADAFALAEKNDKLVLVYFHQDSEPECKRMRATTWSDEKVLAWIAENAVAIEVDIDADPQTAARLGVSKAPVVKLMEADRRVVELLEYYHSPGDLLGSIRAALAGRGEASKPEGEHATEPYAWLGYANFLFRTQGDAEDTARAYFWCLDKGDIYDPGFRARHFEFLLKRLSYLRRRSAEAAFGGVQRRNDLEGRLMSGAGSEQQAYEFVRFNFWLREQQRTADAFAQLVERGEEQRQLARVLLFHELGLIVGHRHYAGVLWAEPDPLGTARARLDALEAAAADASKPVQPIVIGALESRATVVADAANLYEALLHEGRGKDAAELLELVVTRVPNGRAYGLFIQKSNRLELWDLSRKTGDRGLEVVSENQKRIILAALSRVNDDDEGGDAAAVDDDDDGGR
jgi:thioredoxin-like negative regulator of GroEL